MSAFTEIYTGVLVKSSHGLTRIEVPEYVKDREWYLGKDTFTLPIPYKNFKKLFCGYVDIYEIGDDCFEIMVDKHHVWGSPCKLRYVLKEMKTLGERLVFYMVKYFHSSKNKEHEVIGEELSSYYQDFLKDLENLFQEIIEGYKKTKREEKENVDG